MPDDLVSAAAAPTQAASTGEVRALGFGLMVSALLLVLLMLSVWPAAQSVSKTDGKVAVALLIWPDLQTRLLPDVQLLILAMLAGGIGSFVHTATSFSDFVGNQKLARSWLWWYVLKPFIGMALALVFFLALRGGLLSADAAAQNLNAYGITALGGLVGMFSKQATDKLGEIFNVMFRTAPEGGDANRKDRLKNGAAASGGAGAAAADAATSTDDDHGDACSAGSGAATPDELLPAATGGVNTP